MRHHSTLRHGLLGLALTLGLAGQAAAQNSIALNIPSTHPRLWYGDPARLAQARTWYQTHPIDIPGYPPSAAARNRALRYLMTGDENECAQAIEWLMRFNYTEADQDGDGGIDPGSCDLDSEGRYCDRARWFGEDAILVYDWCHAEMTPEQRTTLTGRWVNYTDALNEGPYGWQARPINNYYWGFLRNSLLFGIAATGDTPRAQEFIDHALGQRFQRYFVPWAASFGRGGVSGEGTQYGPYPLGYSVIALQTARDFGYDPYARTSYFGDATYYLTYGMSGAPTLEPGRPSARFEMFPFGDDHDFAAGGSALQGDYANLLAGTIMRDPGSDRARHARAWLQRTQVQPDWWLRAALGNGTAPSNDDDLPLDYIAHGYGFLYARAGREDTSMRALFEMGALGPDELGGTEHNGLEAGSFQLWRTDRFVSRESTGYRGEDYVRGYGGAGRADIHDSIAHNTLLFERRGQLTLFHAQPVVKRLQSAEDFTFAAVDLRNGYRAAAGPIPQNQCWLVEDDWPYADVAIREFLFLREWNVAIVFDRTRGSADSQLPVYANPCTDAEFDARSAAQVQRTFLLHFPTRNAPVATGRRVSADNGPQAFDAHLVLPATSVPRIVDERGCTDCNLGQYRMEVEQSGSAEGYFLHVLHSREVGEAPLQVTQTAQGNGWTIELVRADGARATVRLEGGMTSTGGSVRFGTAPAQPLYPGVQRMDILPQGPVWETLPIDRVFAHGFENP